MLNEYSSLLACPACGSPLSGEARPESSLQCPACSAVYPISPEGIPLLFCPNEGWTTHTDVTNRIKAFYEETPFPNYDDMDSRASLARKAGQGLFARLLSEQIPAGARVLEAGCGTGQLTNFLGFGWQRTCFGSDICLNSLRLADGFKQRFSINNANFLQMNLFRPAFRPQVFDVVISNRVLHHTGDPQRGFESIGRLVRPGGYILIGLYNHIGRLTTDFRRWLFSAIGDGVGFLDAHMRNPHLNAARKRAWFMDQYKNPHESKHCYSETIAWFDKAGFDFLFAIPKIDGTEFSEEEQLFQPHSAGNGVQRFLTECEMLLSGGADGALYIVIGRKRAGATG